MKYKIGLIVLILVILIQSSFAQQSDGLLLKAKNDQVQLGFWKKPNLNYVTEDVPSGQEYSIWDIPNLEEAYINTSPTNRNDGLVMGELGVDGGVKDMIVQLAQEIADGQHGVYDSMLISYNGKLLFESYYKQGRVNLTQPQSSAIKSYTSLALGCAIQQGYLTMADLDKPLINFLKELDQTTFIEGAERVTLHQALTMRSGIRISDEQMGYFQNNPSLIKGQALVQAIFEKSEHIVTENLNSFSYGNFSTGLAMQVIEAVVPGTAEDFIKNEFFGKMGITNYSWKSGLDGLPAAGWRTSITARSMLKLGTIAMNNGQWKGEQMVPEAYVSKATSRIVITGDEEVFGGGKDVSNQGYGYFWWSGDLKVGDKSYYSVSAQGGGGNYIVLIKELDLMVVFNGHGENHPLQLTAERILPAFVN